MVDFNKKRPSFNLGVVDVEASDMKNIDKNADVGLQFLAQAEKIEYTEEEEKAVRRKIDLHLLPIVSF